MITNTANEGLAVDLISFGAQDYLLKSELDRNLISRSIRYAIEKKFVDLKLHDSVERFKLALKSSCGGFWEWDLVKNEVYYSDRWLQVIGEDKKKISSSIDEWMQRIHPDDVAKVQEVINSQIKKPNNHFEQDFRIQKNGEGYVWVRSQGLAVRNQVGQVNRIAGTITNIDKYKNTEERLIYHCTHDDLTNLPNKDFFLDRLRVALTDKKANSSSNFAVLFLDLDRFKVINESIGHTDGDKILIEVSKRLRACLQPGNLISRFGGDEFIFLIQGWHDADEVIANAQKIVGVLMPPIKISGHNISTSGSVGIVYGDQSYTVPEEIIRDVEIAMYHAKICGQS